MPDELITESHECCRTQLETEVEPGASGGSHPKAVVELVDFVGKCSHSMSDHAYPANTLPARWPTEVEKRVI
ncbi:hypothetical protein [Sinomonas sp.]|uniref:hypothetical protein n=1 Tax=Sinomonas sp. TaxID=1914986 RepID=UPI003F80C9AC